MKVPDERFYLIEAIFFTLHTKRRLVNIKNVPENKLEESVPGFNCVNNSSTITFYKTHQLWINVHIEVVNVRYQLV